MIERPCHACRSCGSTELFRNGKTKAGAQKFGCKACGAYGTLELTPAYSDEEKETILAAYRERSSMRGVARTFGVARPTLAKWIKKSDLAPPFGGDVATGGAGRHVGVG
jgi:transposase-like protein